MAEVATNTLRDVSHSQAEFAANYSGLETSLNALGIKLTPIPWSDLREWRGYWKTNFPTYAERREYVRETARPTYEALQRLEEGSALLDTRVEAEGTWAGLNTRIDELGTNLLGASTLDDWQDCGRRSREILVHLSKLMAVLLAGSAPEEAPQAGNGKAWMDIFLDLYVEGPSNKVLRSFYRSTWDLAQRTTHADIDEVEAYASAQAVVLLVRSTEKLLQRANVQIVAEMQS